MMYNTFPYITYTLVRDETCSTHSTSSTPTQLPRLRCVVCCSAWEWTRDRMNSHRCRRRWERNKTRAYYAQNIEQFRHIDTDKCVPATEIIGRRSGLHIYNQLVQKHFVHCTYDDEMRALPYSNTQSTPATRITHRKHWGRFVQLRLTDLYCECSAAERRTTLR